MMNIKVNIGLHVSVYLYVCVCLFVYKTQTSPSRGRERGESFPGPHDVWGPRRRSKILKMVFQVAFF